jgi:hypothetical protein
MQKQWLPHLVKAGPQAVLLFVFVFVFCGVEDGTQDLGHAGQMLYHWATPPVHGFLRQCLAMCSPGWPLTFNPPASVSLVLV